MILLFAPLQAGEVENIVNEPGQPRGFRRDDVEKVPLTLGVVHAAFGQQFRKHANRGQRGFKLVRDVADEIGLLAREGELALEIGNNQPAPQANGEEEQRDEQPETDAQRIGRPGELGGIGEINSNFPVGQDFADFARYKWTLPITAKVRAACRDGPRLIIEQPDDDFAGQSGFDPDERREFPEQSRMIDLHAENQVRVALWAAPEHEIQFVLEEARESSFRGLSDKLAKLRWARGRGRRVLARSGFGGEDGFV